MGWRSFSLWLSHQAFKPSQWTPEEAGSQLTTEPWSLCENSSSADIFWILTYIHAGHLQGWVGFRRGAARKGKEIGIWVTLTTHHLSSFNNHEIPLLNMVKPRLGLVSLLNSSILYTHLPPWAALTLLLNSREGPWAPHRLHQKLLEKLGSCWLAAIFLVRGTGFRAVY